MPDHLCIRIDFFKYAKYVRRRQHETGFTLFDPVRKIWVNGTREEVVRQLFVQFLIERGISGPGLISVEKQVTVDRLKKRYDIAVHDKTGSAFLLVECKAPEIRITDDVMSQVATYNLTARVPYICVTNGTETYLCRIDFESGTYDYLDSFEPLLD